MCPRLAMVRAVAVCCAGLLAADPGLGQAPAPSSAEQKVQSEKLEQLEKEQARLLRQLKSGSATTPELSRKEAEIKRRIDEENRRIGRRGYVTPSTQEVVLAMYYKVFAAKIECAADKRYPEVAKGKAVSLVATVSVLADGRVEKVEIEKTSGLPEVDAAVPAIVRAAAPFGRFPPDMRQRFDVLEVTSKWNFVPRDPGDKSLRDCP